MSTERARRFASWELSLSDPGEQPIHDETRNADRLLQIIREPPEGFGAWLWLSDSINDETSICKRGGHDREGSAPKMLGCFDTALLPSVGDQLGVKVATLLGGQWRSERVVEGEHNPPCWAKGPVKRAQRRVPNSEVVERQRAGDAVKCPGFQGQRFREIGHEEASPRAAPSPCLFHHRWAEVEPYDVRTLVEQPLALRPRPTCCVQHNLPRQRSRNQRAKGWTLKVAVERSIVGRRGPYRCQSVIRLSGQPGEFGLGNRRLGTHQCFVAEAAPGAWGMEGVSVVVTER